MQSQDDSRRQSRHHRAVTELTRVICPPTPHLARRPHRTGVVEAAGDLDGIRDPDHGSGDRAVRKCSISYLSVPVLAPAESLAGPRACTGVKPASGDVADVGQPNDA